MYLTHVCSECGKKWEAEEVPAHDNQIELCDDCIEKERVNQKAVVQILLNVRTTPIGRKEEEELYQLVKKWAETGNIGVEEFKVYD